jgi:putative tricarboxylic transport membrane protein
VLGLSMVTTVVTDGSALKSLAMIALGLLLSTVGQDFVTGEARFAFGLTPLVDGLGIAVVAIGLFGVSEVLMMAQRRDEDRQIVASPCRLAELLPARSDWVLARWPMVRGSGVGFFLGLLPGAGALLGSFASYVLEKRLASDPSRFGKGAIQGVAGPEAANNAAAQSAFIPLLSLGIPPNAVMGVVLGALMMQGVAPGPKLAVERPDIFWGVIASMLIGNLILMVLNVPLVRLFVALLRVPSKLLAPAILLFCAIGAFSVSNSLADVVIAMVCGVLGWLLRRAGFDLVPLLLAFVLGGILEKSLRQALLIGYGSPAVFLERPIALGMLMLALVVLLIPLLRQFRVRSFRQTRPSPP